MLNTISDLVRDVRNALNSSSDSGLRAGADSALRSPEAYADAVVTYLAFSISKAVDRNSSLCFWETDMDRLRGTFGRQLLPMIWDFADNNPFAGAGGDIYGTVQSLCEVLDNFNSQVAGYGIQSSARTQTLSLDKVVSTDPPNYDNIGYADLSDFFYVWLRRSMRGMYSPMFDTLTTPKEEELVATPCRHGGNALSRSFSQG